MATLLFATAAWAKPTTPEQARSVVSNWLGLEAAPMGAPLGGQVREVQTFNDASGNPAYYVVYLNPSGLVFLPADDLVEPIIGFLPEGVYDPSPANPLGALVSRDIPGRVLQARQVEAQGLATRGPRPPKLPRLRPSASGPGWKAPFRPPRLRIWNRDPGYHRLRPAGGPLHPDPLVPNHRGRYAYRPACYNYFTPPYPASSSDNYPAAAWPPPWPN